MTLKTKITNVVPKPIAYFFSKRHRRYSALLAALFIIGVFFALFDGREKIFTIDVQTEKIVFNISDPALSEWHVGHAKFIADPFQENDDFHILGENAFLELVKETQVEVQRHGIQSTHIVLRRIDDDNSVGTVVDDNGQTIKMGAWASFEIIPKTTPLVLPFRGTMTVGDDVTVGVNSILLFGHVKVLEAMIIKETRYTAGDTPLDRGDRISVWLEDEDEVKEAIVEGFIRVEPTDQDQFTEAENAMQLVAHGNASFVKVDRLGSAGYQIRAPKWARFLYDPLLAFVAALGAILFAAIEIYSKLKELFADFNID